MANPVRFPSTFWSTLVGAPERARAAVYTQYRVPIFNYILNHGFQDHDAEDLTQEVFARVCNPEFLAGADREKGKFRNLLLSVARHLLLKEREKRRRRRALSIEQDGQDAGPMAIPADTQPDSGFDTLWTQNLLRLALQRLMEESSRAGPRYYEALVMTKLQGLPQAAVAERLGVCVSDVNNWVHHAKRKIKEYIHDAVRTYSSTDSEYRDEIALVNKYLK